MFKKIINYFKESKEELSKVVWPTRKQTLEMAIAVVIIVIVVGIYLGGVDYLLTELTTLLIGS
jgi:preprotein translocase subunit SecE